MNSTLSHTITLQFTRKFSKSDFTPTRHAQKIPATRDMCDAQQGVWIMLSDVLTLQQLKY